MSCALYTEQLVFIYVQIYSDLEDATFGFVAMQKTHYLKRYVVLREYASAISQVLFNSVKFVGCWASHTFSPGIARCDTDERRRRSQSRPRDSNVQISPSNKPSRFSRPPQPFPCLRSRLYRTSHCSDCGLVRASWRCLLDGGWLCGDGVPRIPRPFDQRFETANPRRSQHRRRGTGLECLGRMSRR